MYHFSVKPQTKYCHILEYQSAVKLKAQQIAHTPYVQNFQQTENEAILPMKEH